MKPAICAICGKRSPMIDGDWVEFSDYAALPKEEIGHPNGLEWFCREHLSAAKSLASQSSKDAILHLKNVPKASDITIQRDKPYRVGMGTIVDRLIRAFKAIIKKR